MNINDRTLEDVSTQAARIRAIISRKIFNDPYANLDELQKELEHLETTYEKLYDIAAADPTSDHYNGAESWN